jgi:hypothetical protein
MFIEAEADVTLDQFGDSLHATTIPLFSRTST